MSVSRLVVAGTHSGVGKTTVTLALLSALKDRGRQVQAFKAGPDFIDPGHHAMITGRPSHNLDGWMLSSSVNREIFLQATADADLSIIEGMMGLFDGSSPVDEVGSTAALAKQLDAPVLLVIDGSAMARSAAAMALGYARFDQDLRIVGVVFNRVNSEGHYRLLKEAVEAKTGLATVGYLRADPSITVPDRHLGLVTAMDHGSHDFYARLGQTVVQSVNLDLVEVLARRCGELNLHPFPYRKRGRKQVNRSVRVGVADDAAFCFYYSENLELLEAEGAELMRFSPLRDGTLPDVDLLYLGGGYPELHGEALAKNVTMRTAIRDFASRGGTIYAECGGMMYLTEAIRDFEGRSYEMVGLFPAEAVMRKPGLTLGYREIEIAQPCVLGHAGLRARGHEFHYSSLVSHGSLQYACNMTDASGHLRGQDGLMFQNTLALYTHLHFASRPSLARTLIKSAKQQTVSQRTEKARFGGGKTK